MQEKSPGWVEYVKLEFSINLNEFNILQEFGEHGECGDEKIELVSEVLSNILSQTFYREKSYYGMDLFLHGIERMFTKLLNSPEVCLNSTYRPIFCFSVNILVKSSCILKLWFKYHLQ